jgi:hypothetical protein
LDASHSLVVQLESKHKLANATNQNTQIIRNAGETVVGRSNQGDTYFTMVLMMFVVSTIMTLIGGMWLHWLPIGAAVLVSGWAGQAMSSPRKHKKKRRR